MDENSVNTEQASGQAAEQASATTAINETKQTPDTKATTNGQSDTANVSTTINDQVIQSELKRAREEAAARRVEAVELKAKLDASEAATDKLKADHVALQAKATTLEAERAMALIAKDAIYPDLLLKQINVANVLDEAGNVDGEKVASEMGKLRSTYPDMFRGTGGDAGMKTAVTPADPESMSQDQRRKWLVDQGILT